MAPGSPDRTSREADPPAEPAADTLRMLVVRVLADQEEERRRVARGLHDGAGGAVTAIRMAASAALMEADHERRSADLQDIIDQADAALAQLRALSSQLRPPQLDALGLAAALRWHVDRLSRDATAAFEVELEDLPRRPDMHVEQACYRIAEEALANALAHARADTVRLRLRDDGDRIHLDIRDDGRGFDPDQADGTGLATMRERARGAGAILAIASAPGRGTRISITAPCPRVAAPARASP